MWLEFCDCGVMLQEERAMIVEEKVDCGRAFWTVMLTSFCLDFVWDIVLFAMFE